MKNILTQPKIIIYIFIMIFFVLIIILIFTLIPKSKYFSFNRQSTPVVDSNQFTRRLDGLPVEEDQTDIWPVAVMIDNHPEVWDYQTGLNSALIVYSTLVEGGYTRLMGIFAGDKADKIGPVRSARPYFIKLAKEVNALYAHSGGSPEALQTIEKLKVYNLEEATSYGPEYIWRETRYPTPHNLFTDSDKLLQAVKDWKLDNQTYVYHQWQYSAQENQQPRDAFGVIINYSAVNYFKTSYEYNQSTKKYLRSQGDQIHIDNATGEQISVKNIVIQFVPEEVHLDEKDRLFIDLIGEGNAWIISEGHITKGRWQKQDDFSRTVFYDSLGQEAQFVPGNTWIEIVPGDREVEIRN